MADDNVNKEEVNKDDGNKASARPKSNHWTPASGSGAGLMEVPGVSVEKSSSAPVSKAKTDTSASQDESEVAKDSHAKNVEVVVSATKTQEAAKEEPSRQAPPRSTVEPIESAQTHPNVKYERGCAGAAWQDILKSESYFARFSLMGLIKFIPILDWFVDGYAMRWGRDLILDEVGGMPKKIFGDRTFVNGAMNFLVALVISIVTGVLNMVLGWIPVFGLLVGIALWLFMDVVKATLVIRMAVFDELGEGFNITAAMKALKGNWPKVLFIVAIPAMIIFAIGFLFAIIWTALYCLTFGGEAMFTIYSFINQLGGLNSFEKAMANNPQIAVNFAIMLLNVGFSFIIFYLPCFFVINVLGSFLTVLQTRAMGHFVARYCQSWKLEPKFDQVKRL